jgi:cytochrome c oxidase subunit 2
MALKIERYERIFLYLTVTLLTFFLVAIVMSIAESGIHLPSDEGRIDPAAVRSTPPFDQPGVYETGPGTYDAVVVGQVWAFDPATITVPAGSEVTFVATSTDVIHGFQIWDTTVNAMLIPGQITRVTARFDQPGEYEIVCHEYCGTGHHTMYGKVVVSP